MIGFEGNKTLLPLVSGESPFDGSHPILLQILNNLPPGPKAIVINYKKEALIHATRSYEISYYEQPLLNGTGGALIAAREFLDTGDYDHMIITMGDVPFVSMATYLATLLLFVAVMLAMAIGVLATGRRLKGSCGGTGRDCSCDDAARKECALAKQHGAS